MYFEEHKYVLVKPKKDLCDTWFAHRLGNVSEEEWRTHIFSQKSVIAKLCAWANGSREYLDILAELDKVGAGPKKKKKYKNARV